MAAVTAVTTTITTPTTVPAPTVSFLWAGYTEPKDIRVGISDPSNGFGVPLVQSLDRFTGRRTSVINIFIRLDDVQWKTKVGNIVAAKYVPMITVEPRAAVAPDDFWAYVSTIGPCYVRFAHEMNGDWYPWGNIDPKSYLSQWNSFFAGRSSNASRVWCVNSGDNPASNVMEPYYPGDGSVDLVGVDGYNRSTLTPAGVFEAMRLRLRAITQKPLGICETGTGNGPGKGLWISQLYDYAAKNFSYVAWFNGDRDMTWGIFGQSGGDTTFETHTAYTEYAQAIARLDSRYR